MHLPRRWHCRGFILGDKNVATTFFVSPDLGYVFLIIYNSAIIYAMKIITDKKEIQNEYPDYLRDESRLTAQNADALAWPETEEDVRNALQEAARNSWNVTASAARTGIVGGAVPIDGGMILSLEKMCQVKELRSQGDMITLRLQPGMTLQNIAEAASSLLVDYIDMLPEASRELRNTLADENIELFYPPDPTEMTACIGGTCATNASGARSFRYGATRTHVQGLRVVLADGTCLDLQRGTCFAKNGVLTIPCENGDTRVINLPSYSMPPVKHCAGYYATPEMDAIDLFIGSEGTLGIITECTIALSRHTGNRLSVLSFFPTENDALRYVSSVKDAIKNNVLNIDAIEFFGKNALQLLRDAPTVDIAIPDADCAVYIEVTIKEEEFETVVELLENYLQCSHSSTDASWAGSEPEEIARMKEFRHAVPETINSIIAARKRDIPSLHKIATDLAVPDEALLEMLTYYRTELETRDIPYVIFGHIGDNHLHVNMLPRTEEELKKAKEMYQQCAEKAVSLGGTVSAEHGIGKLKRAFLVTQFGNRGVAQMKAVKDVCDPKGILGKNTLFITE